MRKLILIISCTLACHSNFGQNISIKIEDFGYYYILGNKLFDVRSHKALWTLDQINPVWNGQVQKYNFDEKLLLVLTANKILCFDSNGKLSKSIILPTAVRYN